MSKLEYALKSNVKSEKVDSTERTGAMNAEAVVTIEDSKTETGKVDGSRETTTAAVAIGIARNVRTTISRSEQNAIDAANREVALAEAEVTTEAIRVVTDKADGMRGTTTAEGVVTTEAVEIETVVVAKFSTITTGIVRNVKTIISHSEQNATGVESHVVEAVHETKTVEPPNEVTKTATDEAMTVATRTATDEADASNVEVAEMKSEEMGIGTVRSVKTTTSHSEPNATDAVLLVAEEEDEILDEILVTVHHNVTEEVVHHVESFPNAHLAEKGNVLRVVTGETEGMSAATKIAVHTTKPVHGTMSERRNASLANLAHSVNLEGKGLAMRTTAHLNH
ncbi:MAG: hypothetical protein L7U62_01100 [Candidatus Poseidoniaceae archaeon]|nr:hypothetical protein [Candidatus Poseidoniaceae archaeon]